MYKPGCDFIFSRIFNCDVTHNKRAIKSVLVLLLSDDLRKRKWMGERKEEDGRRRGGWDVIQIVQCVSIVLQCGYYTACRGGRVQLAGGQEDTLPLLYTLLHNALCLILKSCIVYKVDSS